MRTRPLLEDAPLPVVWQKLNAVAFLDEHCSTPKTMEAPQSLAVRLLHGQHLRTLGL